MRHTKDNHIVQEHERVYEPVIQYFNAEWSEYVPQITNAADVPVGFPIWKSQYLCQLWCNATNRKRRVEIDKFVNQNK